MKIYKGTQVRGPVTWKPSMFIWGGCIFINVRKRSWMISLPQKLLDFLVFWGFDPYDG